MFPVRDDNPSSSTPVISWLLIASCVGVFLYQITLTTERAQLEFLYGYGMIPANLFGYAPLPDRLVKVPAELTVITSMFLHGGILHLGGNMLFLYIFGDNIEDAMGAIPFIFFYLACGVVAALVQGVVDPDSTIPMIGASGAISGILGAYLMLYPWARVYVLVFFGIITFIPVPAVIVLGLWFAVQLGSGLMAPADEPGIAFWAHIGGFVAGVVLHRLFGARPDPYGGARRRGPWDA